MAKINLIDIENGNVNFFADTQEIKNLNIFEDYMFVNVQKNSNDSLKLVKRGKNESTFYFKLNSILREFVKTKYKEQLKKEQIILLPSSIVDSGKKKYLVIEL